MTFFECKKELYNCTNLMCLISVVKIVQYAAVTNKSETLKHHYIARFVDIPKDTFTAKSWCYDHDAQFLTWLDIAVLEEIVDIMSRCQGMLFSI